MTKKVKKIFLTIDGKKVRVKDGIKEFTGKKEHDPKKFKIGSLILIDGEEIYTYNGELDNVTEDNIDELEGDNGLYYITKMNEYSVIGSPIGLLKDCDIEISEIEVDEKPKENKNNSEINIDKEDLFNKIMQMDTIREPEKFEKEPTTEKPKKEKKRLKDSNKFRIKRDDKLEFEINSEDDLMVRTVKELVNSSNITMGDLYDKIPSQNKAYNLFYGLSTRSTMTWQIFETWMNLLDKNCEIVVS